MIYPLSPAWTFVMLVACIAGGAALSAPASIAPRKDAASRPAAVRYQVKDVERSVKFYTGQLGFRLEPRHSAAFAAVSRGNLVLWLSGPGSSGSRPMPDGRQQAPGGWNRIALEVEDLAARVAELRAAGVHFRNEIVSGPGGKQIQVEDPDGNPIEFFQPAAQ
jgi:glyoxylase I family protein